ncbi:hypothetical protein CMI46_00715 [Candidatus Pacearchaeota archaeon]|nr:hypothetical protein [Candidatus Pacearchaeota archaeon]
MLFSLIQIYSFYLLNFTILVPFRRLFLFYLIGISILAGVGLIVTTNYLKKLNFKNKKIIIIALIILILSTHYYFSSDYFELPKIIGEKDYTALQFIKQNYPKETIVLANPHTSLAITPVTGMSVPHLITANIYGDNPIRFNEFFIKNCDRKEEIIQEYINPLENYTIPKTKYQKLLVYSNDKINCPFLKETYSYPYVYEVTNDYFNSNKN